jgi:hypothetical protein
MRPFVVPSQAPEVNKVCVCVCVCCVCVCVKTVPGWSMFKQRLYDAVLQCNAIFCYNKNPSIKIQVEMCYRVSLPWASGEE